VVLFIGGIIFDTWFVTHAGQFHLHEKHQPGDPYCAMAFTDQPGYDAIIREMQEAFAKRLQIQKNKGCYKMEVS
jgi:metallo-beta-lactamase class B